MRLKKARIQKYRSIRDTDWFDIEDAKTILVGPNEAGKTALLQALQQLNAPEDVPGFDPLRDYPRSEYNDITTGKVLPKDVTVVAAKFTLDSEDKKELPSEYWECTYFYSRTLDNKSHHWLENAPLLPTYAKIKKNLKRLCAHVDPRIPKKDDGTPAADLPSTTLAAITKEWKDHTFIEGACHKQLSEWLDETMLHIDEANEDEETRYSRLEDAVAMARIKENALQTLYNRLPVFVLFNNYFRVRANIHLEHLAARLKSGVLDDASYDYGNQCLLKLLGFTAQDLSKLGNAPAPRVGDAEALKAYRDQLDTRSYQLNAASVRLTKEIREVWVPNPKRAEADSLKVVADGQYLKVVVNDDLGVEIELDQRSEGFQWLVSFFIVFFAEAIDKHKNAILLLDEPGLSLHGLKQREFRTTISRLAKSNQTLYTTHSPFLVGPDELDLVRVVEMTDRKIGTKIHTTVTASDPAALLPLQEALGYDLAQSLFGQQRNLVLEGLTDYWYLDALSLLLDDAGLITLNKKIALVPAGGAGKVVYYATILHAQKLKVAALLDSDTAGDQAAQQDELIHSLGNKAVLRTKDAYSGPVPRPEIEDLLRSTLVQVAKTVLGWDVSVTATAQPKRPIVDIFTAEISDFSKYRLAKAFLRWSRDRDAGSLSNDERRDWKDLIKAINAALK